MKATEDLNKSINQICVASSRSEYFDCEVFFPQTTQCDEVSSFVASHQPQVWHWRYNLICPGCSIFIKWQG